MIDVYSENHTKLVITLWLYAELSIIKTGGTYC
jgi:hypothetical protein